MHFGDRSSYYIQRSYAFITSRIIWFVSQLIAILVFSGLIYLLSSQLKPDQSIHFEILYACLFLLLIVAFLALQRLLLQINTNNINFHESLIKLIELSSDWYWQQDENLVITNMLYKGKTVSSGSEEDIKPFVGKSLRDIKIIDVLDRSLTWEAFVALNESGKTYEGICLHYFNENGLRCVFEASGMPFFGSKGNLKGYHCISSNITQKWLTETFVAVQRNFLQGILLSTPISRLGQQYVVGFQNCLMHRADMAMGYRETQQNTTEVFQSSGDFKVSKHLFDQLWALPEENLKTIESYGDKDLIRAGCLPSSFFYKHQNFSNSNYSVVWAVLKKGIMTNQPDYWVVIAQKKGKKPEHNDVIKVITGLRLMGLCVERLDFESQLQALNQNLETRIQARTAELTATNQELKAFSYTVSHDLRAPLRAINGFSNILIDEYSNELPDDARDLLNRVVGNSIYMGELIDGLLDFSSLLQADLVKVDVDFNVLVKEVLASLNAYNRIEVNLMNTLPTVKVDPILMRQVWQNLIENAIKFSSKKDNPKMSIACEATSNGYKFVVEDNGVGFDMTYSSKLFQVFARLHHNRDFQGNGVGLAIVKRIIEKHQGQIFAEASPGKGAKFVFTLNN